MMDRMKKFNESNDMPFGNIFIEKIEVVHDIAPLKKGLVIDVKKPLLFLVGDNGSGKSTIMECIADVFNFKDDTYMKRSNMKSNIKMTGSRCKARYLDFHGSDKKFAGAFGNDISLHMRHMKSSAGEVTLATLISSHIGPEFNNGLLLLDEPCRGLSIKNQLLIAKIIDKKMIVDDCQIICNTHSEIILRKCKSFAQFFNVKTGLDTTYEEYMEEQGLID